MEKRTEIYQNGKLIQVVDTRTVSGYQKEIVQEIKKLCQHAIYSKATVEKQLNLLANRLDSSEATEIENHIDLCRSNYESFKSRILSSTTIQEIEDIGREAVMFYFQFLPKGM